VGDDEAAVYHIEGATFAKNIRREHLSKEDIERGKRRKKEAEREMKELEAGREPTDEGGGGAAAGVKYETAGDGEEGADVEGADGSVVEGTGALSPGTHQGVGCDVCGMSPLQGIRYHKDGADYDLCEADFSKLPVAEQAEYVVISPAGRAAGTAAEVAAARKANRDAKKRPPVRQSLSPPDRPTISWAEYINNEKCVHLGRQMDETIEKKPLKPKVWMSDTVPLKLESIVSLFSVLASTAKQIEKVREFIEAKLPDGFPVKFVRCSF
jgi:hypothetical protein